MRKVGKVGTALTFLRRNYLFVKKWALSLLFILIFAMTLSVHAHAGLNDGLVSYWTFDENSGITTQDSAGSNTGSLVKGPTWITGKIGSGALQFDGLDDYITSPDSTSLSSLEGSNQATISYWVKRNSTTASMGMISQRQLISIYSHSSFSVRAEWRYGGSGPVGTTLDHPCSSTSCVMPLNEWHHVVVTYNNPTSSIYIDGQLKSQKDGAGGVLNLNNSNPLEIGRYATFYFNGSIDDVRIYNRALAVDEIRALCGQATGGCPVAAATSPAIPISPTTPITPSASGVPTIYSVKQDGTGNYTTIQACADVAKAGDTCLIYPGTYLENVSTKFPGTTANPNACAPFSGTFPNYTMNPTCDAQRITFKSASGNVTVTSFYIKHPFIAIDGLNFTGTPSTNGYIQLQTGADYCNIINNIVHDGQEAKGGIYFSTAANNCSFKGNQFNSIRYLYVYSQGHGHLFEGNSFELPASSIAEVDFLRPFGDNIVFRRNIFKGNGANTLGGHPDLIQVYGNSILQPSNNILFEQNWVQDVSTSVGQLGSRNVSDGKIAPINDFVLRNNVFYNVSGNFNTLVPGVQMTHNTFYRAFSGLYQGGVNTGSTLARGDSSRARISGNAFVASGYQPDDTGIRGFYSIPSAALDSESIAILDPSHSISSDFTTKVRADLVNESYTDPNGGVLAKAKALASCSDFTLSSSAALNTTYSAYKNSVCDYLLKVVAMDNLVKSTSSFDYNFVAGLAPSYVPKQSSRCIGNDLTLFNFCEPHGINGGNPLFTNESNPQGPDGVPFTLDDGLKPLAGSSLCAKAEGKTDIGAYSCDSTQVFSNIITSGANSSIWYVDNAVTTSGDGKSWETAWKNFADISWNNIKPGDTLYVSGGPSKTEKIYQENWTVRKGGELGNPITISIDANNYQHNGKVVFDFNALGEAANVSAFLLVASNLVFDGNVAGESHFEIRNLFNTTNRIGGIGFGGNAVQNVTFRYLTFTNVNVPIRLTSSSNIEVHHSHFKGIRGDAAIFISEPIEGWDVNRIHDNDIELLWNNGGPDGIQGGGSLSIYRNKFRVTRTNVITSTQHTDDLQVPGNYIKIFSNEFINVGDSVVSPGSWGNDEHRHDIWVFNNIFRMEEDLDPYPQYFRIYNNVGKILSYKNLKILNNTFVGNNFQPIWIGNGQTVQPTGSENEIKNNIFLNSGAPKYFNPVWKIEPSSGYDSKSWSIGNNVYFHSSGVSFVNYLGSSYKAVDWIASFETTGSVISPKFVRYVENGADNDFHLPASDAIAKDQGANLSSLCNQVPELCQDKDGIARPAIGSWEIGAYEFNLGLGSGDVSGDGKVTMYDTALVLRYTLGASLSDTQKQKADINGDDRIDGADVVAIARKALGL